MNVSVEEIEKAVAQFYYNNSKHSEAHQWLTLVQLSPNAWNFCWDLLSSNKPPEIQFFGANTLHLKLAKCWAELLPEQYGEMKRKLVDIVLSYAKGGPKIVLTKLCVALACFIIRTLPDHWTSAVSDILVTFQPSNVTHVSTEQLYSVLAELLTVIPEEFQSLSLAQSFRGIVRNCLHSNLIYVLPMVQQMLMQTDLVSLQSLSLRCLSSWVQFGIPLADCDSLVIAVLNCVREPELTENAIEVLTNIVIHPDTTRYPKTLIKLLTQLLQLEPLLTDALQNKNIELCASFYNLFVSVGESHSRILLEETLKSDESRRNVLKLVEIILQCSGAPGQYPVDETYSNLPFSFWYTLQDDIVSATQEKSSLFLMYFTPYYESLINILLVKVMYPTSQCYQTWNSEEKEDFRCYRQDIGDTLMYCYQLLRQQMLERLLLHLHVLLRNADSSDIYQALESCLYAFQSVAESVDLEDSKCIPQFFSTIPQIPMCNLQVMSTTLDAIGAYAEWINTHPEVLGNIVPFLTAGIGNPEVAPSATLALKDIARDCQLSMQPFAEHILITSKDVLSKGILKPHEQMRLMSAVGYVASVLPFPASMAYLNTLLVPYMQELQSLAQPKEMTPQLHSQLLMRLNMFSMLFVSLDPKLKDCADDEIEGRESTFKVVRTSSDPHPVLLIMQQFLPVLKQLGSTWKGNGPVAEVACELLKRVTSNLLDDATSIVPDVLDLVLFFFQSYPNMPAIELLKQLIILFGKDSNHRNSLNQSFRGIMNLVMELCRSSISEQSDVAEVFMQLLNQLLKKQLEFLFHQDFDLASLFHFGVVALAVPEAPVVKAAGSFLVSFVNYSRETPATTNIVNNSGEALLIRAMTCIGGESPRGVMDTMADILLSLNKKYFDNMCRWMNTFLIRDNFPSERVNRSQKEHFIRAVLKERSNKRKLQDTVKEFTLLCRGLTGTEYALQILPCL